MNKHFLFMGMAAALLFASCSNDDELAGTGSNNQPLASDESIALSLSQKGIVTRAPLGNVDSEGNYDGTFDADSIGVFCLATGKIYGKEDINWSDSYSNPNNLWFVNRSAKAVTKNDVELGKKVTAIEWEAPTAENEYSYFYPMGSQYSYTFYGYYPYSKTVKHIGQSYKVEFDDIDGIKDIIWGQSKIDSNDAQKQYAWSAKYYREKSAALGLAYKKKEHLPNIEFRHKLMKFNIIIKKGNDEDGELKFIGVNHVALQNVCTKGTLTVATREEGEVLGDFEPDWTHTGTFYLKGANDAELDTAKTAFGDDEKVTIGQGFLLPVLKKLPDGQYVDNGFTSGGMAGKGMFRLQMEYFKKNLPGKLYKSALYEIAPPEGGWKEGFEYDIVITVSSPLKIEASASLVGWEKGNIELQ